MKRARYHPNKKERRKKNNQRMALILYLTWSTHTLTPIKMILLLFLQFITVNTLLHSKKVPLLNMTDHRVNANVKIYSNLAEIIQPLG
jgi:hypothetical protein